MSSRESRGLSLRAVSKSFGRGFKTVPVLRELDLEICSGELVTVMGASGGGKTTLIRIIAGLEQPDSGEITLDGHTIQPGDVGYIFQKPVLYPYLTVKENILFGVTLSRFTGEIDVDHYRSLLSILGLEGLERRRPNELSGGQQQRVGIARALIRKPPLVLFDEPLASVDEYLSATIRDQIEQLHARLGFTGLFITHHLNEAFQVGQRVAIMVDGTIAQIDSPPRLLENPKSLAVARLVGEPALNVWSLGLDDDAHQRVLTFRSASVHHGVRPDANSAQARISKLRPSAHGWLLDGILEDEVNWLSSSGERAQVQAGERVLLFSPQAQRQESFVFSVLPQHCWIFSQ